MSDMSTFDRESLHENEIRENRKKYIDLLHECRHRESLYENTHLRQTMFSLLPLLVRILVREQESSCKQYFCMSTFIENPCTRTRKGGPRSRQSGGLPGELFMRILAREWANEKQR